MKPTQEQVIAWAREAGLEQTVSIAPDGGSRIVSCPPIDPLERFATLAYEAGRKDENEACASLEVHLITPTRDYTTMSPLDCYEAALMDEAMAFREAIRARIKT